MAVPTFTSVSPTVGSPAGGQVVEIVGTNFRTTPVQYTVPQAEQYAPVKVTFAGVLAEYVQAVSSTLLRVAVPTARFDPNVPAMLDPTVSRVTFPAVDVVITNLDIDGNPITGEAVTATEAYTYEQPLMRLPEADPPMLQVFRSFLYLLKSSLVSRAAKSTHTDYGEDGAQYTILAAHPSVGITLSWLRDPEYSHYDNERQVVSVGGGIYKEFDVQKTVMMVAELVLSAKTETELFHLCQSLTDLVLASPWLTVAPDIDFPGDLAALQSSRGEPSTGLNKYPLEEISPLEQIGNIGRTNVKAYSTRLRVRGIPFIRGDPSQTAIHQISTIELTSVNMQGQNPVTVVV